MIWPSPIRLPVYLAMLAISVACATPQHLPLLKVEAGTLSNVETRSFRVVSDLESFRQLYATIHGQVLPPPTPPAVDFDSHIALLVFLGRRSTGGHRVGFGDTAEVSDGIATVPIVEQSPPANAALAQVVTTPYAIAMLGRGDYKEVVFADTAGQPVGRVLLRQ